MGAPNENFVESRAHMIRYEDLSRLFIILTSFMSSKVHEAFFDLRLCFFTERSCQCHHILCIGLKKGKCSRRHKLLDICLSKTTMLVKAKYKLGSFVDPSFSTIYLCGISALSNPYSIDSDNS